jgi:ketosteroid isomerase-like protein
MPATHEPILQERRANPTRDPAVDNLAVVRMWWTVLESEWRTALSQAAANGRRCDGIVEPCIRTALEPFESFEARVEDLLAWGDRVVVSLRLRGRVAGASVAMSEAWVCRLVEGRVADVRDYTTLQDALASVAGR